MTAAAQRRSVWLGLMQKIAGPILSALAEGRLHACLPVEKPARAPYAHLEAFGRTVCGIAPWIGCEGLSGDEAETQRKFRALMQACLENATDPASADRMNFSEGYGQALVDAAFLAQGLVRAPHALLDPLAPSVRERLSDCLALTRKFQPYPSNWLLFSAMIEAALCKTGAAWDRAPVDRAIEAFERWYVGDGAYGDDALFRWDYYNSFVIHPMYEDVLTVLAPFDPKYAELLPTVEKRARRFAAVQERMISPEGTYPMLGRSLAYRFGAFHALAQAARKDNLPTGVSPAQVRCALTAVMERTAAGGLFDANGFLTVGVCGSQPSLGEHYISVGSAYLCTAAFLPLGLPPTHPFWTDPDEPWTNKKIWAGQDVPCDTAED